MALSEFSHHIMDDLIKKIVMQFKAFSWAVVAVFGPQGEPKLRDLRQGVCYTKAGAGFLVDIT
jgi:hypothetical protein